MPSTSIYKSYEAFVYKWINISNNKIYIGKHKGTPDDGYISSGREFLDAYFKNPSMFVREIIWYGSDKECLKKEGELIREEINSKGYKHLYNRTHWRIVKEWKRTCLHCGQWCDPANEEWAQTFELHHFENCKHQPQQTKNKFSKTENFKIFESSKQKTDNQIKKPKVEKNLKNELKLCKTVKEKSYVKRFYRYVNNPSIREKEIKRLRDIIDKMLY